jgi:hypothetical protein
MVRRTRRRFTFRIKRPTATSIPGRVLQGAEVIIENDALPLEVIAVVKRLRSHFFITPLGPSEQTIRRIRRNNFQLINSAKRPVHDRLLWGEKLPMLT